MINCHICGKETDFYCRDCDEPVCEDCCVVPTYMNQIDYALCLDCQDSIETQFSIDREAEFKLEKIKEKRRKVRRKNYWKPENIKKRRVAKEEKKRLAEKCKKESMEEAVKIVSSMFKGMF